MKRGKIKQKSKYSYKAVFYAAGAIEVLVTFFSAVLYLSTRSVETALPVFILLTSFVLLNMLRHLFNEYHLKKRIE